MHGLLGLRRLAELVIDAHVVLRVGQDIRGTEMFLVDWLVVRREAGITLRTESIRPEAVVRSCQRRATRAGASTVARLCRRVVVAAGHGLETNIHYKSEKNHPK